MNPRTFRMTATAMLMAVALLLGLTPLGFIPLGIVNITILCIPVILAGLCLGWKAGAMVGLVFALTSVYNALVKPSALMMALQPVPLVMYTAIFIPRIGVGITSYFTYTGLKKLKAPKPVSVGVAAAVGSLTNTVLFLGIIWLLGAPSLAQGLNVEIAQLGATIGGIVLANGLPEAAAAVILCVPITMAVTKKFPLERFGK